MTTIRIRTFLKKKMETVDIPRSEETGILKNIKP
jgi:hypothetical protein